MKPVNNISRRNIDNRFEVQRRILAYLATVEPPRGGYIGNLPGTGEVVDALGLPRNKCSYASVSRSLARLCASGKVERYYTERAGQGKGARWALA
jgi:hypothetical protein